MTAQEWKKWWGSFDEWPESGSIAADNFYITAIENADAIIRSQQERIERLTAKIAELKAADELYEAAETGPEYSFAHQRYVEAVKALLEEMGDK